VTIPDDAFSGPGDGAVVEVKRDRWGRPIIDGKGRTRASSVAKPLEDTYNLEQWHRRNVAYGVATDSSLVARILAIGGDPADWSKDDKKAIDEVITAANTAAKSHRRADIGTALHRLMERVDQGEDVNAGPYAADIDAYRRAMDEAGLIALPEFVEVFMYNADADTAGTCDNIALRRGRHVVADKKTGGTVDFGALGFSAQLAAYAGGVIWDPATDKPLPTPDIDQDTGYIIHVPAGEGRCNIYEVDLTGGREAIKLANAVRQIRSRSRKWLTIATPGAPSPVESPDPDDATHGNAASSGSNPPATIEGLRAMVGEWEPDRITEFNAGLVAAGVPKDDPRRKDYDYMAKAVERYTFSDAVAAPVTRPPVINETTVAQMPTTAPDEGGDADGDTVALLEARYNALDADGRSWVNAVGAQATKAGLSFAMSDGRRTVRRFEIMRGLIALADGFANDDAIRGCAAAVNAEIADAMSFNLGQVVGHMGADDAALFANLAVALVEGEASMRWTDDRRCRVEAAA
jgi:hypothetical protein